MPRNSYDEAFGVVRLQWQQGEPSSGDDYYGPVVCEVWRPEMFLFDPRRPEMRVHAQHEIRVFKDGKWWRVDWTGGLSEPKGKVRRHATMNGRTWHRTITIDGWGRE